MILTTVWLVFDPGPSSTLQSICREQHWRTIGLYEQTKATMHSDQESAIEDARARLRARDQPTTTGT